MPDQPNTNAAPAAIILCGGRSSRMGQAKALLDWHGVPLVERMVEKIRPSLHPILLVASKDQTLPLLPGATTVFDDLPFPGPVSAFRTGLRALGEAVDTCLLLSCDLPLFEPRLMETFASAIGEADFAMPYIAGVPQPLCALYRVAAARKATENLPLEGSSMGQLRQQLAGIFLDEVTCAQADPGLGSFRQCNTAEEFALLLAASPF